MALLARQISGCMSVTYAAAVRYPSLYVKTTYHSVSYGCCAGRVFQILKNWPERRIKVVCITDGERVGALGDLGVQVSLYPTL